MFSARDVAYGLIEVGRGESYRAASARVRTRANRHPERGEGPVYSRHGQLAADFVEVFAPVVFEPYRPTMWPDTLVLDQVPFRVKAYGNDGRPIPGGLVAFNVFGALGYHDGRGLLWRLEAFHTASGDDWEAFVCALDGEPKRVVCDAHTGIRAAVQHAFPNADIWLCEWHLREKLRLRLVRARANTNTDRVWQRLPAAVHSQPGWEQFCSAAYRHRPVLTEVRTWIDRWDDTVRAQLDRRPTKWQRERGAVVSSAGLDRRLNQVRDWLTPRRNAFSNRDRLSRLLMLMQLQLNDLADETATPATSATGSKPATARPRHAASSPTRTATPPSARTSPGSYSVGGGGMMTRRGRPGIRGPGGTSGSAARNSASVSSTSS